MFFYNKSPQLQYGFSENEHLVCLVNIEQQTPHIQWIEKPCDVHALCRHHRIVYPLPHHFIWRKVLFFPQQYSRQMCHRQIIQHLQQALPLPLADLHFDYQIQPLANHWRITLFALRRSLTHNLYLNKNSVIDCECHCLIRALHFLHQLPMAEIAGYCYPFGEKFLQFKAEGMKISETRPPDAELLDLTGLSLSNEIPNPHLYLLALGAALWNGTVSI